MTLFSARALSFVVVSVLLLGSTVQLAQADTSRRINLVQVGPPNMINPALITETTAANLALQLFDTLVRESALGPQPALAERWQVLDGNRVFRFAIRDDARWSDGTPITAEYLVESYRFRNSIEGATDVGQISLATVGLAQVDGEDWLEFSFEAPNTEFLHYLTDISNAPLPIHKSDVLDLSSTLMDAPAADMVFSGPYRLISHSKRGMEMAPNPAYYHANTLANGGVVVTHLDGRDQSVYAGLRSGVFDVAMVRQAGQAAFLRDNMTEYLFVYETPSMDYLVFNVTEPPFDDPRLRQAIALVVNFSNETEFLRTNTLAAADSVLTHDMMARYGIKSRDATSDERAERLDEARRLMAEAGYDAQSPLVTQLLHNESDVHSRMAHNLRSRLSQIHIDLEIRSLPWVEFMPATMAGEFSITRWGWLFDINHPSNLFKIFTTGDAFNIGGFSDTDFDTATAALHSASDPAEIARLVRAAETILTDQRPVIPLYQRHAIILKQPDLVIREQTFNGYIRFETMGYPQQ